MEASVKRPPLQRPRPNVPMAFAWVMAWRETRAAWRHFLYFFICIALGVSVLVSIGLFGQHVEQSVTLEARALMAADLEVRLSHPLSDAGQTLLRDLFVRGVSIVHASELVAMAGPSSDPTARPASQRQLSQIVELKAIEEGYPFYGTVRVVPQQAFEALLHERRVARTEPYAAIAQESLLLKMGLALGDRFRIGDATFVLTGVIQKEPDRVASLFSLGPRVLISQEGLTAAGLVKPGSRVRERYLLRVPPELPLDPLLAELRGGLAKESARVLSFRDAQPQLRRFLEQLTRYLGLIGLTALFVGGIGVASTVQAFIRGKLTTIAILKTLGTDSGRILQTYLLQALFLGSLGSLAGAALGIAIEQVLPTLLKDLLPLGQLELSLSPSPWPILNGVAMGLLTTGLFSLWPLLGIRQIRPAGIFRRDIVAVPQPRFDALRIVTMVGVMTGLGALAMWQAGSVTIGLIFIAALVAAVLLLRGAAGVLVRLLRRAPTPHSVPIRQAIRNVSRPGSQAPGILISVGIGVMVMVTASLLERSLVDHIGASRPVHAPTFFFIDIQPDQKDGFMQLLAEKVPDGEPAATPLVRSRLYAIDGRHIEPQAMQQEEPSRRDKDDEKSWYVTREYVLTFLSSLPKDNLVVKGEWWNEVERQGGTAAVAQLSVEEEAARHLGLDVGSIVEFDIQGTVVAAEVRSIRKVDWSNFSTNFYMILSPGSLQGAPVTYVATARVAPGKELAVQGAVVQAFPNVTAINIGEVMDNFSRILERLSIAIRTVALFCIFSGGIVMAAALATTRYQRLYESVILKAVGATRGVIAQAFAAEYAILGTIAGLLGVLLASALSWTVLEHILEVAWRVQPSVLIVGVVLTVVLTVAVGFASSFGLLKARPLQLLRGE